MKVLRSISAIILAFLVLFSSTSFIIGMHFCGHYIENVALFSKANRCEMDAQFPPCENLANESCCNDQTIAHEGQDFKISIAQIDFSPAIDIITEQVPVLISEVVPITSVSFPEFYNYDPPLRSRDLTVSFQVFLI